MNQQTPPLGLADMLCFDVYSANLAFGRVYKPLLDSLGLTYLQFLVLLSLWEQDGQGVGDLGAALDLDSSTLTPLIKRLESAGFVSRNRDAGDERRVRVTLTDAGRALQDRAPEVCDRVAAATGLTLTEFGQLRLLLRRLRGALQQSAV